MEGEQKVNDLTARDVMTTDLYTTFPSLPLADLQRELCQRRISGAPVVERDRLVGLVSRADIVQRLDLGHVFTDFVLEYERDYEGRDIQGVEGAARAEENLGRQLSGLCVRDAMTTHPITVASETPVSRIAKLMCERRIHRVVVTERDCPVGIVATLDLVRLLSE